MILLLTLSLPNFAFGEEVRYPENNQPHSLVSSDIGGQRSGACPQCYMLNDLEMDDTTNPDANSSNIRSSKGTGN